MKINNLPLQTVESIVCNYFHINTETLFKKSREIKIREPRQIFHYLSQRFTNSSLDSIAKYSSNKNHTTVLHSVKVVSNFIDTEWKFKKMMLLLEEQLRNQMVVNKAFETKKQNIINEIKNDLNISIKSLKEKVKFSEFEKELIIKYISICESEEQINELLTEKLKAS